MRPIDGWQIKSIYAMGGSLGLTERGRPDDNLHQMVESMTGKEHVRDLSFAEAQEIIGVLKERMRGIKKPVPTRPPGGATEGQQRKVWHLMYNLADYDTKRSKATLGERLCGIIKRELHVDANPKQPLQWLSYQPTGRLIEILKGYVSTVAQRRRGDAHGQTDGTVDTG